MLGRELLEKKYPAGTRVKMIEARSGGFTLGRNALGTVMGINQFGGIDVDWDDDPNLKYDLFTGYDRFSVVFGK